MFDFSEFKETISNLENNLNAINQYSADTAADENERLQKIDEAILATAQNTEKISNGLKQETRDRKLADTKNMQYTKKRDKINLAIALIGIILATVSFIVSLVK